MSAAWVLAGPTATGKTAIANELARRTGRIVLSADSMLVYKGMDIGTAKPTKEELEGIDIRGVDMVLPTESFSVGLWLKEAYKVFEEADRLNKDVIVAGGTGLYIASLINGIDAPAAEDVELRNELNKLYETYGIEALWQRADSATSGCLGTIDDKYNPRRVIRLIEKLENEKRSVNTEGGRVKRSCEEPIVGLWLEPQVLSERILERVRKMYQDGLAEETERLCELYEDFSDTAGVGIGYAEARAFIVGAMTQEEAIEKTAQRTRALAKRQRTWFKHQHNTHWVNAPLDKNDVIRAADDVMKAWEELGPTKIALS